MPRSAAMPMSTSLTEKRVEVVQRRMSAQEAMSMAMP